MGGMAIYSLAGLPIIPLRDTCEYASSPFASSLFDGLTAYRNYFFGVKVFNDFANFIFHRFQLFENSVIGLELPHRLHARDRDHTLCLPQMCLNESFHSLPREQLDSTFGRVPGARSGCATASLRAELAFTLVCAWQTRIGGPCLGRRLSTSPTVVGTCSNICAAALF